MGEQEALKRVAFAAFHPHPTAKRPLHRRDPGARREGAWISSEAGRLLRYRGPDHGLATMLFTLAQSVHLAPSTGSVRRVLRVFVAGTTS